MTQGVSSGRGNNRYLVLGTMPDYFVSNFGLAKSKARLEKPAVQFPSQLWEFRITKFSFANILKSEEIKDPKSCVITPKSDRKLYLWALILKFAICSELLSYPGVDMMLPRLQIIQEI